MMEEGLLTGSQQSTGARGAKKMCAALGLMLLGASFMGVALYSVGAPAAAAAAYPGGMNRTIALSATMPVQFVEARASGWAPAANEIIAKLKAAGAKRGQIISIDAHNNGPTGEAIFSAYWVPSWPDQGPLDILYTHQNSNYGWSTFSQKAVEMVHETDIISITGSCNSGGYSVLFNFYYTPSASHGRHSPIGAVESRASSWNGAANGVLAELKNKGVKRGQIIGIDAHNNGPTGNAIFAAFYDLSLPSFGDLDITYSVQNTRWSWNWNYEKAASEVTTGVISITSSVNSGGYTVTYVFNYK